jgi:multiple sugar transport system substrate-binding protein
MSKIQLKGITWGHSRGITPLLALAQRYNELHPDVEISWRKRTLQEFADFPIEKLTEDYDLLIIDHPWVGCAAATQCVLDLSQHLPKEYLDEQERHSVGYSHLSYAYGGGQWALAIDAATPVPSYRADLIDTIPQTWDDLLILARKGKVAMAAIPIDILMNFYTFCIALGEEPFQQKEEVVSTETGRKAIETMKELYGVVDRRLFNFNPIAVAEWMSSSNDIWYCPFAYGYSNYSRTGYAKHLLHYTDVVRFNGSPLRTTVGGTGLSVSAFSQHKEAALDFAQWAVSPLCQQTIYVQHGGQPGHLLAWQNTLANQLTHDYFTNTLPALQRGYIRPRYNGYLHFQDHAGDPLQQCLLHNGNPVEALEKMNHIYRESLKQAEKQFI